jgi:putative flippase GtrA
MAEKTDTLTPASSDGLMARVRGFIKNKEFERFWKFAVVGAIGAVIDFGTYTGLLALGWLDNAEVTITWQIALTDVGIAGAIAFTLAVISNFIWNRYWTYPDSRSKSVASQLVTFFLVNIVGILIRIPILELLSQPLDRLIHNVVPGIAELVANMVREGGIGESAAWALAVVIVMFWNFFVNRYWTYNDVD